MSVPLTVPNKLPEPMRVVTKMPLAGLAFPNPSTIWWIFVGSIVMSPVCTVPGVLFPTNAPAAPPGPATPPEPLPAFPPLPVAPARPPEPVAEKKADPSRLAGLYHEMKTYIDLEMWELAFEKATAIVENHAGTKEAELVSRNLNELRWKAEPKFVAPHAPITPVEERQLREKGLAAMYNHVKTYMDLEMWELARQKAVAILKSFPDSPEAAELMKSFETIERKARESVAAPVAEKAGS